MATRKRMYTTKYPVNGSLRIEDPVILFTGAGPVVYLDTADFAGFYADLETTKDIIAQLAAIVAKYEKRKPTLQTSITGDDFRV